MPITVNEKELTAVGISVAAGCQPCTDYHLKAVRKTGASVDEIKLAVANAITVREHATRIMQNYAREQLGEARVNNDPSFTDEAERMEVLVSIGAAFAVNCTASFERYLAAAQRIDISQEDIAKIVDLAVFIKGKAASHVERLVGLAEEETV